VSAPEPRWRARRPDEGATGTPDEPVEVAGGWRSLAPRVAVLWRIGVVGRSVLLGAAYAIADMVFGSRWEASVFHPFVAACVVCACAVGGVVGLVHAGRHVRSWRYQIGDDGLVIEWGVFWRRRAVVLRHRIVTFEISAGPVRRKSGLWKLQIRTGNSPEQLVIPGLEASAVDELATALGFGGTVDVESPA